MFYYFHFNVCTENQVTLKNVRFIKDQNQCVPIRIWDRRSFRVANPHQQPLLKSCNSIFRNVKFQYAKKVLMRHDYIVVP